MTASAVPPVGQPTPAWRTRAVPYATVVAGSCLTAVPLVATVPLLPPFGLLLLIGWRLHARFAMRRWAAAPLGLADDLVSGQPLGSAMLLWSLCFLAIDLVEQRLVDRSFGQDWLIATGAIVSCLVGGRFIAIPLAAHVEAPICAQMVASALLFPLAARLVAWVDARRGHA